MNADKIKKPLISKISARIAVTGAVASGLTSGIIVHFLIPGGGLWQSAGIGVLTAAASFLAIYFISYSTFHPRLEALERINKNITRKKFEDYEGLNVERTDELSLLVKRATRASKVVEKEIQRLNKIENYRKEFIGDISHELKTPIFAIQGFIETLLNGAVHDDEVNEMFLKKAMRNVNRLTYLTKDLMEISRLETGELKSDVQEIFLRDLVLDVAESLQYKSQKEEVEIRMADFNKNLQVTADRNQIRQVLINLIENGIKYNRTGGVVEIGTRKYEKDENKVLVYVKDTGIGIDPKDIPRVTERFYRVDKSRSREKGGTGLGLSIVKHIIEAHGESLYINSSKEGSEFSFTLSKVNHILA